MTREDELKEAVKYTENCLHEAVWESSLEEQKCIEHQVIAARLDLLEYQMKESQECIEKLEEK